MIMKRQSSQTDQAISHGSGTDWQVLGELELPLDGDAHSKISIWLSEVLSPLQLHAGFLNKVLTSAEDAAARAMQTETVMKYQHTYLLIYISAGRPLNAQTWGFFRIDKVERAAKNENFRDHSIEFYLYLEGR